MSLRRIFALSATVLTLSACGDPSAPTIEEAEFAAALNVDLASMTRTASGLYWKDLTVGTGATAVAGKRVFVRYTGWLADGTQFDRRGPADPPFSFVLGTAGVIAGWDEGVAGMRVGGRRQLVIPPSLGYGGQQVGPIPPNSILVFEVEVVEVQ